MNLEKVEAMLAGGIEGFFGKHLSGEVMLPELTHALTREIRGGKQREVEGRKYVPSVYTFTLNETDYGKLSARRIIDKLKRAAKQEIIRQERFIDGSLTIVLRKDLTMERGFKLTAEFSDDSERNDDTIVVPERGQSGGIRLGIAYIEEVSGDMVGTNLLLDEGKIYIGRAVQNDFVIQDASVSRQHASIEYIDGRHFLRDEKSANGTMINGEPISGAYLSVDDEVCMGNTVLTYGVM